MRRVALPGLAFGAGGAGAAFAREAQVPDGAAQEPRDDLRQDLLAQVRSPAGPGGFTHGQLAMGQY